MSLTSIRVKVLFFATLKERAGVKEIDMDIQESTPVMDFKELLGSRYPALQEALPSALISINREYAFDQDIIPGDAEIAIFPPVSGGTEAVIDFPMRKWPMRKWPIRKWPIRKWPIRKWPIRKWPTRKWP